MRSEHFNIKGFLGMANTPAPQKIAFNNNEPIAMKFEIEIVCTQ